MTPILIYLLKVAFSLSFAALFFHTCLKKETYFKAGKITMFSLIVISWFVPFLKTSILSFENIQATVNELDIFIADIAEIEVTGNGVVENKSLNLSLILFSIWIAGVIFRFSKIIISHIRIRSILYQGYEIERGKQRIIVGSENISSFSYFNTIFLSANDYSENKESIVTHEKAHIKLRHSYEIIFIEIIQALQWFNPFVYILKKDLIDIHEFEADNYVLGKGIDCYEYQNLLIKKAVGTGSYTLANSFNHSSLKKRITMMLKPKSSKSAWLKLVGVIPVTLVSYSLFASQIEKSVNISNETELFPLTGNSDNPTSLNKDKEDTSKTETNFVTSSKTNYVSTNDSIYNQPEVMPEFPGGENALLHYIASSMKYPEEAVKNKIEGRVIVSFIVEKDGSVADVKVVRPIDPLLDNEAVRVVKDMPLWTPGTVKDEKVRVKFTIPISFRLKKENTQSNTNK